MKKYNNYIHYISLLLLSYFVIFFKLGGFHMRWWDESIFAVNTYEMIQNGNYFSNYFNGIIDFYNTKPPLTNWFQIIFVKLIGYNEVALRLPSAIAATLTILLVFKFVSSKFNYLWAWLSALILLTSNGFINFHTARTADADALLTLFILLANLSFIKIIFYDNKKHLLLFFLFITLAFATKLEVIGIFFPAYLIILLWQKKIKYFTFNWQFLIGSVFLIICCLLLIYLRNLSAPGYLDSLFSNESNRFFNAADNHHEPILFYFTNFFTSRFSIWSAFLLIGVGLVYFIKNNIHKKVLFSFIVIIGIYLTIITIAGTKLAWYDMPIYPLLSVIAAFPIFYICNYIKREHSLNTKQIIIFIILLFFFPYYLMFSKSQGNTIKPDTKRVEVKSRYLFEQINSNKNLDGLKVYHSDFIGSLLFYKYQLKEKNQTINIVDQNKFQLNDIVLVSEDSLKINIKNEYHTQTLSTFDNAVLLKITGLK